jgi:HAD superfamily hydrolase (TIGR01509 family)
MACAYIFDFDGVLMNSMDAHFVCYSQALKEAGVPIDREQFYRQAGMTGEEQIRYFINRAGATADVDKIRQRKKELWQQSDHDLQPIECNLNLMRTLRASGVPVAIATGSSRETLKPIMRKYGIEVDALATADDVTRGKPHPDLFLAAAAQLGVAPENCIVVEDSEVGVEAARAGGMKVLRFYDNKMA